MPRYYNRKNVYYAHSMQIYGTEEETADVQYLSSIFSNFVCPNNTLSIGNKMSDYTKYVRDSVEVLVAKEHKNHIGKGVFLEIQEAQLNNIPCFVLRDKKLYPIRSIETRNVDDWKVYYGVINTY